MKTAKSNIFTLFQLSASHPAFAVKDFATAEAVCNAEGGRLWQPRNLDAFITILKLHDSYLSTDAVNHVGFNPDPTQPAYTAIGLKVIRGFDV